MKKIFFAIATLATLIVGSGCSKDYFDINTNPNSPSDGGVTPEMMLPLLLHRTAAQTGAGYSTYARWMGYWSRGGDYGASIEEESYQLTTTFSGGVWNFWYDVAFDAYTLNRKAAAGSRPLYQGAAKVVRVISFMNLVDVFNNVPYSQAFDLSNYILPAYDKGADIYKDLFVQLDEAVALFNSYTAGSDLSLATSDIMFGGDPVMWKKLANTLRLKLLIHTSQVNIVDRAAELAKITSDGYLMSGETAAVNPGYGKSVNISGASQQNPFWDNYKADINGIPNDRFNRANNYVLNRLKNSNDIRYQYYFEPAAADGSYTGTDYGRPTIPQSSDYQSKVSGPGLARSESQDQWYFTSVESMFLQAEAVQRGWIPGSAETAYRAAVTESFRWLGVTNADAAATAYMATPAGSYTGTVERLINQKYLGLVGINNMAAWTDWRRTGFPADIPLSLAPSRGPAIPTRYLYPQTEYNVNPANVAAEGTITVTTPPVFWDN